MVSPDIPSYICSKYNEVVYYLFWILFDVQVKLHSNQFSESYACAS